MKKELVGYLIDIDGVARELKKQGENWYTTREYYKNKYNATKVTHMADIYGKRKK